MIVFFASKEAKIITTDLIISVIETESNKITTAFSRRILVPLVGSQKYFLY